ncbi:MAG: class I SAM-dependent methyltransferase [Pirellulaceae bacterium]
MPLLSDYAQRKKIANFLDTIPRTARVLEIGCGSGWVGEYLKTHGWTGYVGLDLTPPADVVGNVRDWRQLGLEPASFDAIVAFEVVEHVDCFRECYDLLAPGGRLMLTSPVPRMDWAMKCLEWLGLNQQRTSPHDHLIDFHKVPYFEEKETKVVAFLSQWGIFRKTGSDGAESLGRNTADLSEHQTNHEPGSGWPPGSASRAPQHLDRGALTTSAASEASPSRVTG